MPNTSTTQSTSSTDTNSAKKKPPNRSLRPKNISTRPEEPVPSSSAERIKFATGTIPKCKDTCRLTSDPYNKDFYMFSADDSEAPEAHFYRCDATNMKWTDLTHRLTYRVPHDPFSDEELEPKTRQLPRVSHAGITLLRFRNASFIVIFGGYDHNLQAPTSNMIFISLKNLGWWFANLEDAGRESKQVSPRISPEIVAIDKKIYIFGGYRRFGKEPQPCTSFSIAEYALEERRWRWVVVDKPYPAPVPNRKIFGGACTAYNGKKILLGPGRLTGDEPIDFERDDLFFYDIIQNKFQPATLGFKGGLPQDVAWYFLIEPHIWISRTAQQTQSTSTSSLTEPPPILMCVWIPVANTQDSAPEIWQLSFPKKKIECLHVSRMMWDLDTEFEECLFIGSPGPRIRFIGTKDSEPPVAAGKKRRRRSTSDEDEDDMYTSSGDGELKCSGDNATWNVYFDIPLLV